MKTLNDYKEEYDKLLHKKSLKGKEALEAVKQDGNALQYVKEQTPEICLEAVKQDGYALRYVNENIFTKEPEIIELNGKKYKLIEE